MLASPREFWLVVSLLCPVLFRAGEATPALEHATTAFVAVGEACVAGTPSEPGRAWALFAELALPKLVVLLRGSAGKRHNTLRVLYSFAAPDAATHVGVIKAVKARRDAAAETLFFF